MFILCFRKQILAKKRKGAESKMRLLMVVQGFFLVVLLKTRAVVKKGVASLF